VTAAAAAGQSDIVDRGMDRRSTTTDGSRPSKGRR